jgi:hypothetical protein
MKKLTWLVLLSFSFLMMPTVLVAQEDDDAFMEEDEFEFAEEDEFGDAQDAVSSDAAGTTNDEEFDPSEFDVSGGEQDLEYIDDLLQSEDGAFGDSGFAYDDGNRRDPFASLLEVNESRDPRRTTVRPEGIPGLEIDAITVTGVWITEDGPVAQVQAANKAMSYLIRPGDQLYDGDVLRISYERYAGAEVVFKQIVDDPQATKPFREVVRRLDP